MGPLRFFSWWHSADWPFAVGGTLWWISPCICFSRVVARIWLWCLPSSSLRRGPANYKEKTPHAFRTSSPVRPTQSNVLKRGTTDDLGKVGAFFSQSWTWFSFRLPNLITVQKCFPNLKFRAFYCVDRTHTSWVRYLKSHNLQSVFFIFFPFFAWPHQILGSSTRFNSSPITESLILFALESRWNET